MQKWGWWSRELITGSWQWPWEYGGGRLYLRGEQSKQKPSVYLGQSVLRELHLCKRASSVGHVVMWSSSRCQLDHRNRVVRGATTEQLPEWSCHTAPKMPAEDSCEWLVLTRKATHSLYTGAQKTNNNHSIDKNVIWKFAQWVWRNDSIVKSICCSSRELEFDFQHPECSSEPSVTLVPKDLNSSSSSLRQACGAQTSKQERKNTDTEQ